MDIAPCRRESLCFFLLTTLAFLVGLFLRLYLLADQVLIDDEWHGLYYAIGKTPGWLLTHFAIPGATCIPQNLYCWALLKTVGWSELALRLPSLVFGLAALLVFPILIRDLVGRRRAALFALLLAVSPLLVFYSRLCRPYGAVAFLAFASILYGVQWMRSGLLRHAVLYAVAGVFAVYFHLFAVVAVAAPVLCGISMKIWQTWRRPSVPDAGRVLPAWPALVAILMAMAVAMGALMLPALVYSLRSTFFEVAQAGAFGIPSLVRFAVLVSGTGHPVLCCLFGVALVAGAVDVCRRAPLLGFTLVSLLPLHLAALALSRPHSSQAAIVLARYCIPMVPAALLLAACGLDALATALAARCGIRPSLSGASGFVFAAALALAGPLPQTYVAPNSFTHHGAYQHRYALIDWSESFHSELVTEGFTLDTAVRASEISPFYRQLAGSPGAAPVVEYPMMIGDHFNPLYYYQRFHRRPVIVGYTTDMHLAGGLAAGNIYGNTYVDQVLSVVGDLDRLRFRNLIAMDDVPGMRVRGVEFVILHQRYEAQLPLVAPPPPDLPRLIASYRRMLGRPAYEDPQVVVFRLRPPTPGRFLP